MCMPSGTQSSSQSGLFTITSYSSYSLSTDNDTSPKTNEPAVTTFNRCAPVDIIRNTATNLLRPELMPRLAKMIGKWTSHHLIVHDDTNCESYDFASGKERKAGQKEQNRVHPLSSRYQVGPPGHPPPPVSARLRTISRPPMAKVRMRLRTMTTAIPVDCQNRRLCPCGSLPKRRC